MRKTFTTTALLLSVFLPLWLHAQHGSAPPGYYPLRYSGDTWTGTVTSIDRTTRAITLTYTHKDKTETFTGVIDPGGVSLVDRDGAPVKNHHLEIGEQVTVYYIAKSSKHVVLDQNGKKHEETDTENDIFKLQLFEKQKK